MTEAAAQPGTRSITPVYRALMSELERRRLHLGLSMWQTDDEACTQDGYYAKALWADARSGRQARWETLQLIIDALFPTGFDLVLRPRAGAPLNPAAQKRVVRFAAATVNRKTQRELMREIGMQGLQ